MTNLPAQFAPARWSDKFAFEVALALEGSGEPMADILARHNHDQNDLLAFTKDPQFQGRVEAYRKDIVENGLTFRLKARAQAEDLLTTSYLLIHDIDVPAAVKADLIKSTVRWAGLEPTKGEALTDPAKGVSITINMAPTKTEPEMRTVIDGRSIEADD